MKTGPMLVVEAKAKIQELSVQQLAVLLKTGQARIIDVREPAEFATGHIPTAVNMPRGVLEMQLPLHPAVAEHRDPVLALTELASQPLYLICRSGARSALAAESLQRMGFRDLYSIAGGMQAWSESGFPVRQ
ncbi:rhodanese-like domain-containing protein [Rheinheimera sp.]|jgi:rhodanese-related sulfurtransferase|uniref:rhodanese-like domain-containing protein n=1 Tax=Rheinheimera sp. TaxID=1869214 RepID=UPI0026055023|nr:rhodanese-like domain-containing protein [Rheinheimera sp.]MCA1930433.1 rhodanese-like domain-containing protein [Rheinheimera sp.]